MISDERLKRAARLAGDTIISDPELCGGAEHSFSPEFERRIEELGRKLKGGAHMPAWQRAACFFLALLVGAGIWLTVDTEARAEIFGWIKEQYETVFHYHFEGGASGEAQEYELGWVPDGYVFGSRIEEVDGCTLIYTQGDDYFSFHFIRGVQTKDIFMFGDGDMEVLPSEVNGVHADFYFDSSDRNALVWINDDHTMFTILGCFDEAEMVKMAESVVPVK